MSKISTVALESWHFWRPKVPEAFQALAWLAMEAGESSFRWNAVGDGGEAWGPFQWHSQREQDIRLRGHIDVRASHLACLEGAYWEATKGWYKAVWPKLLLTAKLEDAILLLVRDYEQSARQSSDVSKRISLARGLQIQLGDLYK